MGRRVVTSWRPGRCMFQQRGGYLQRSILCRSCLCSWSWSWWVPTQRCQLAPRRHPARGPSSCTSPGSCWLVPPAVTTVCAWSEQANVIERCVWLWEGAATYSLLHLSLVGLHLVLQPLHQLLHPLLVLLVLLGLEQQLLQPALVLPQRLHRLGVPLLLRVQLQLQLLHLRTHTHAAMTLPQRVLRVIASWVLWLRLKNAVSHSARCGAVQCSNATSEHVIRSSLSGNVSAAPLRKQTFCFKFVVSKRIASSRLFCQT